MRKVNLRTQAPMPMPAPHFRLLTSLPWSHVLLCHGHLCRTSTPGALQHLSAMVTCAALPYGHVCRSAIWSRVPLCHGHLRRSSRRSGRMCHANSSTRANSWTQASSGRSTLALRTWALMFDAGCLNTRCCRRSSRMSHACSTLASSGRACLMPWTPATGSSSS